MSKHTPGPWRYEKDGSCGCAIYREGYNQPFMHITVLMNLMRGFPNGDNVTEESDANCNLMAMAPELFKALTDVLVEFGNFCCENCINEEEMLRDHPELVEAINQADSLLKKVRGT